MGLFKEITMKIATAKSMAAENNFNFEYSNSQRLYILSDRQDGWPDQYFPGNVLRSMDEKVFLEFFLRVKQSA
jgi:hypothetical protein